MQSKNEFLHKQNIHVWLLTHKAVDKSFNLKLDKMQL